MLRWASCTTVALLLKRKLRLFLLPPSENWIIYYCGNASSSPLRSFLGLISQQPSSCKPSPSVHTQRTLQREVSHCHKGKKVKRCSACGCKISLSLPLCLLLLYNSLSNRWNSHTHTHGFAWRVCFTAVSGRVCACRAAGLRLDNAAPWL